MRQKKLQMCTIFMFGVMFVLFGRVASAQPTADLDHDIVDENNVPFDMNDLVVGRPLVLLVSSGT